MRRVGGLLGSIAAVCWAVSCSGVDIGRPAQGRIGLHALEARVDSDIAHYYLSTYLTGRRLDPTADRRIDEVYAGASGPLPNRRELKRLSRDFSLDFAALYFADRLAGVPANQRYQAAFDRILSDVRQSLAAGREALRGATDGFEILFVPGYLYRSHRRTGADFRASRTILSRLGMAHDFVDTDEDGPVEANAERVVSAISAKETIDRRLILVSASKSGPEVALALTAMGPDRSRHVAAWINIVGAMQGSPMADDHLRHRLQYIIGKVDPEGVRSLATEPSRRRFAAFRIPPHVLVVNYIGIPLTGTISRLARRGFDTIRAEGPNDGLSLLPDLLVPEAPTLVEMGSDHFLLSERLDVKTVALTAAIVEWLHRPPQGVTAAAAYGQPLPH